MALNAQQQSEIKSIREETRETYRDVSPELEAILYEAIPVLDHGFIRVIDYMGTDASIVQAARVSYGRGTKKTQEDAGLIKYLLRHRHTTPFEMCEIKLHIKLPIFIARQWIRHRTANVNEYSGRYSILDKEFYIPAPDKLAAQSVSNRQGRGHVLEGEEAQRALEILKSGSEKAYADYIEMLNSDEDGTVHDENKQGLARELARMNLPVNFYTQWYWKVDLHNLMHFLALRADDHAQYEIRVYAEAMLDVLKKWVPTTYEAFMNYRKGATEVSATGMDVIRRMLKGEQVDESNCGMSKREWAELQAVLQENP